MSNPKDDITTSVEASETDVLDLKKAHYTEHAGMTRIKAPVNDIPAGLNAELMNMLKIGKRYAQFQGIDRCIRVLELGTANQRHCLSTMVKNLSTNTFMCSNCDRIKDPNANPKVINSSMIRLSAKELEECGLTVDPLANAKPEAAKTLKKAKKEPVEAEPKPRRAKVKTPSSVKIEVTMDQLRSDPNVLRIMLLKTLDAIFELPVSNFREAEEIRVVKERVEQALNQFAPKGE